MRLARQSWMRAAPTRRLLAAFAKAGVSARFVGGAVRNALLRRPVTDIDIATPAPPHAVAALLKRARIRSVPTGIAHGTLTAVVPPRHYEITTLRRDVEPLGRRARVAFTEDWRTDAERRDFTINALFADPDGTIHDFVGGLADLKARRVRFVGDPATRIREDVLRLLRFYRFHAHFGHEPADAGARDACRTLAHLLPTLSAERVAAELLKLLGAPDPLPALRMMAEDDVLARVLPEARRAERLAGLIAVDPDVDPLRRLAALVAVDGAGARNLAQRLRLSNQQRERLAALAAPPWPVDLAADIDARRRALHRLGPALYRDLVLLTAAGAGAAARKPARALLAWAQRTGPLVFPLKGRHALAAGIKPGPALGALLAAVEEWWEAGGCRASRAACRAELKRRIAGKT